MPADKKIIFLATPDFGVPFLKRLAQSQYCPSLVVTQPDRPAGRNQKPTPPPIKVIAGELGLDVLQPNNLLELKDIFKEKFDLCILVAYGMIIPESILAAPKLGWLNVHPSLLPKYRGSSPIQTAVLNGDEKTGVSIIKLVKELDAGPIYCQKSLDLPNDESAETLHDRLAELGSEMLLEILPDIFTQSIIAKDQDKKLATFTKQISREDGLISWQLSAKQIYRHFLAFHPWPGVYTNFNQKRLKITNLSVLEGVLETDLPIGSVFKAPNGALAVKCNQGVVALEQLQLEGKKNLAQADFVLGHPEFIGTVLS